MAVFEICIPKRGEFRVLLKVNDEVIFVSQAYASKVKSLEAIRQLRHYSHDNSLYKIKKLDCGSWCFEVVKPKSKTTIGASYTYLDKASVSKKISQMKTLAPKAKLKNEALVLN